MPDDSKTPISFADALRGWTLDALNEGADDRQFGESVRAELERRQRPCTCYHGATRERIRACPRHQGRRP